MKPLVSPRVGLAIVTLVVACSGKSYSLGRPDSKQAGGASGNSNVGGALGGGAGESGGVDAAGEGGVGQAAAGGAGNGAGGGGAGESGGEGGLDTGGTAAGSGESGAAGDAGAGGDAAAPGCGNGRLEPGEVCDDGNERPGDGCSAGCREEPVLLASGATATCALSSGGAVKCWGLNNEGQLGLGDTQLRGDQGSEMGSNLATVALGSGRHVVQLSSGGNHSCAILDDRSLKCWGYNFGGALGLGDTENRGDQPGEMGDNLPAVELGSGRYAVEVVTGGTHTCVRLDDDSVKCWGYRAYSALNSVPDSAGDEPGEMGDNLPVVDLGRGRRALALAAGDNHDCALLNDDEVKCWGVNKTGQLGLEDDDDRGDEPGEMGDGLPVLNLGTARHATRLFAGGSTSCAILDDESLKCWGLNEGGQLGTSFESAYGSWGDSPGQMGDSLPVVNLGNGRRARSVAIGFRHTCALLDDDALKCWGVAGSTSEGTRGQLGLGDRENRGDDLGEMGDNLPGVRLGEVRHALSVVAGTWRSCALLDDAGVKCWGGNGAGQLGVQTTVDWGDDPGEMGDDLPAVDLVF